MTSHHSENTPREKGFTLVELVITMILIGVISTVVGPLLYEGVTNFKKAHALESLSSQGRSTLELMAQDVRNIGAELSHTLISMNANQLSMENMYDQTISFSLSGSDLIRTIDGNNQNLAEDVSSLSFSYYNVNGQTTATTADVRYIKLGLSLTKEGLSQHFETIVALRNAVLG